MKLSDVMSLNSRELSLLDKCNETAVAWDPSLSVVTLFERQAEGRPDGTAYVDEGCRLSFGQVNERANRLAHRLIDLGVGPEVPVALGMRRADELLVAMMAVLKSGGHCVPVDAVHPGALGLRSLEGAKRKLAVVSDRSSARFSTDIGSVLFEDASLERESSSNPGVSLDPDTLAYSIYTPGTTGTPKGVMIPHRQVLHTLHALWRLAPLEEGEAVAQTASATLVQSPEVWLAGLLAGVPQVGIGEPSITHAPAFVEKLESLGVTRLCSFPSQLEAILSHLQATGRHLERIRHLFVSVESLTTDLLARAMAALPSSVVWHVYGCMELNGAVCFRGEGCEAGEFAPIGYPTANTRTYVLDKGLHRCALGATGELYLESSGLARGYLGDPALTADRFIPNPFGTTPGSRLFRTGDLARNRSNGALEYMGRVDFELRSNGRRIDMREVDRIARSHPAVLEAVATGRSLSQGGLQLAVYYVPKPGSMLGTEDFRAYLAERLPAYQLPTFYTELASLPRLPNGMVDIRGLPEPTTGKDESVAPRTDLERSIAEIWSDVLRIGNQPVEVGLRDNFFKLGGHSLLATQSVARVRQQFEVEVPVGLLFRSPVLEGFADQVGQLIRDKEGNNTETIEPTDRTGDIPLSPVQERLWFIHEHRPELRGAYTMPMALELRGEGFSIEALRRAFGALVARHESLRTTFVVPRPGAAPVQRVAAVLELEVPLLEADEADLPGLAREHAGGEFDLAAGPLLRAAVLRLAADRHVLLLAMHHIVSDGWSVFNVLLPELRALYAAELAGRPAGLPPLPLQYADYARWQRGRDLHAELAYWERALGGYEDGLELPYDRPRAAAAAWRARSLRHRYPDDLARRLGPALAARGCTLFMGLLAAAALVVGRYAGRSDVCLGTTSAGRSRLELEGLIGFFVNLLPLRIDLGGDPTVADLLARARDAALGGFAHEALPFETLLQALRRPREAGRTPLVPVLVRHQNFLPRDLMRRWGEGLVTEPLALDGRPTQSELDLQFYGDGSYLEVVADYAAELFEPETVGRLLGQLGRALEALAGDPDAPLRELDPLGDEERRQLAAWNDTDRPLDTAEGLAARFRRQAARAPGATACIAPRGAGSPLRLSYAGLDRLSDQVAHRLGRLGVGPGARVAVACRRGPGLLVALLGVLKAGGCYVPIDAQYPPAYRRRVLDQARPRAVLADADAPAGDAGGADADAPLLRLAVEDGPGGPALGGDLGREPDAPAAAPGPGGEPACLMYTSGSTADPKGVAVPQAQVLNWLEASWRRLPFAPGELVAQKTPVAFAVSLKELLVGLLAGVPQLFLDDETARDPAALAAALARWRVSRLYLVPSHLRALLGALGPGPDPLPALRVVTAAGEPLPAALRDEFRARLPRAELWNNYGCTELNDVAYAGPAEAAGPGPLAPAGRPIDNTRVHLLDDLLRPVPLGAPGELYVEGAAVGPGYWRQPGPTAAAFLPHPEPRRPGARLYRTGDLARLRPDGCLELLGRRDLQLKVRGHRIDPRQVEDAALAQPGLAEAVAAGWPPGPGADQLALYYAPAGDAAVPPEALRARLAAVLPGYMVPTLYRRLDALPRLPNGKLDRRALPEPDPRDAGALPSEPQTDTERLLLDIWTNLIKRVTRRSFKIGIHDDFLKVGGHSLLAVNLASDISKKFNVAMPVSEILADCNTIAKQAKLIDGALLPNQDKPTDGAMVAPSTLVLLRDRTQGGTPVFCVHPVGGQITFYRSLAERLSDRAPVYGVQAGELRSLSEMVQAHSDRIRLVQPQGPYRLLGWSSGGLFASAIAADLESQGAEVGLLAYIDTSLIPSRIAEDDDLLGFAAAANTFATLRKKRPSDAEVAEIDARLSALKLSVEDLLREDNRHLALYHLRRWIAPELSAEMLDYLRKQYFVTKRHMRLLAGYTPPQLQAPIRIYRARGSVTDIARQLPTCVGSQHHDVATSEIDGDHYSILHEPHVEALAEALLAVL